MKLLMIKNCLHDKNHPTNIEILPNLLLISRLLLTNLSKVDRLQHYDLDRFCAVFAVVAVHSAQITQNSIISSAFFDLQLGRFGVEFFCN